MGLAVLPSRLEKEIALLKSAILSSADIKNDELLYKHSKWLDEIILKYNKIRSEERSVGKECKSK